MDNNGSTKSSKGGFKSKFLKLLADYQGVDVDDINMGDLFFEDLHMGPSEISDFMEKLSDEGFNTDKIDLESTHSVDDMIEILSADEEF